jgi:hypothetical protein
VIKAAALLKARTSATGNEWGAWLYLNPDGTIRVGEIVEGTTWTIPSMGMAPDSLAIGSIHSHPAGAMLNPDLNDGDINHAVMNNIYVVVVGGNGRLYIWPDAPMPGWSGPGPHSQGSSCLQPPCE